MARLSISESWNETVAFVRREGQLLFPIAFLLVGLPAAILQAAMPAQDPGAQPEIGAWAWLILPAMLLGMAGYLVLCRLAVRRSAAAGEAFSNALSRILPLLGAVLLLLLAFVLIAVPILIVAGVGAAAEGSPEAAGVGVAIAMILFAVAALAVGVKMLLLYPVAAMEPVGPVGILRRSWELTAGHFWKLLGFLLLFAILFAVISLAVGAVAGLLIFAIAGPPEPGSVASFLMLLIGAILNTLFVVLFGTTIARIYARLAAPAEAA